VVWLYGQGGLIMKKTVCKRDFWERYAAIYDILLILKSYRGYLADVLQVSEVRGGMKIGDFGCGTGNLLVTLHQELNSSIRIWGYDFSEVMLRQAEQKRASMGIEVHLERLDLTKAVKLKQTFHVIFCLQMLYSLRDPSHVIRLAREHLEKKGTLVVVTPRKASSLGLMLKEQSDHPENDSERWHTNEGEALLRLAHEVFGEKTVADVTKDIHDAAVVRTLRQFGDRRALDILAELASINVGLVRESEKNGHFYTHKELKRLLVQQNFCITAEKLTYAKQCHLTVARKR